MKVLSISADRNIFTSDSSSRWRMVEYGHLFEELHIVIFVVKDLGLRPEKISENVWIYPTNSRNRLFHVYDAWRIGRSLRGKFNVITAQDPFESGLVAWLIKLSTGARLQLQIHTDFLSRHFVDSWLNWFRVRMAKFLLPRADRIRVVSKKIANSLKGKRWKLKATPVVLPIWVDIESLRQAPITLDLHQKYFQFNKIILMVSRLEPEKQIDLAIINLTKFLLNNENIGLVVVGSGSEEQKLKKMVKKMGLNNSVKFEGWQEDIATYYKTADLFLTTSRYEGYGMTIVEASVCGLPVVATDVGVALEMGATIIDNFDHLGLIIKKLFDSPVKAETKREWPTKTEYLNAYKQALE